MRGQMPHDHCVPVDAERKSVTAAFIAQPISHAVTQPAWSASGDVISRAHLPAVFRLPNRNTSRGCISGPLTESLRSNRHSPLSAPRDEPVHIDRHVDDLNASGVLPRHASIEAFPPLLKGGRGCSGRREAYEAGVGIAIENGHRHNGTTSGSRHVNAPKQILWLATMARFSPTPIVPSPLSSPACATVKQNNPISVICRNRSTDHFQHLMDEVSPLAAEHVASGIVQPIDEEVDMPAAKLSRDHRVYGRARHAQPHRHRQPVFGPLALSHIAGGSW